MQVPGVAGGKEGRVLGRRAHGELVGIGLAEQHSAGLLEPRHNGGVVGRHKALEHTRAAGGGDAGSAEHILDGQGNAEEWRQGAVTRLPGLTQTRVGLLRLLAGQLWRQGQVGADVIVGGHDPVDQGFSQLDGRDFAATQ